MKIQRLIPGMRIIKTALSATLCVMLANLIHYTIEIDITGFYASIAAVFTLESTMQNTKIKAKSRLLGTIIGGGVALVLYYLNILLTGGNIQFLIIFIGIIISIQLCNVFNLQTGIMAACVAFLASVTISSDEYMFYIVIRTLETMYGVIIALVVNRYLFSIKHKVK